MRTPAGAVFAAYPWFSIGGNTHSHTTQQTIVFNQGPGIYELWCNARDANGNTRDPWAHNIASERISIFVSGGNSSPQTNFVFVNPNNSASPGQQVVITGNATDPDANLQYLNFYVNDPHASGWQYIGSVDVSGGNATNSIVWTIPANALRGVWAAHVRAQDSAGAWDWNGNVTTPFMVKLQQAPVSSANGSMALGGAFTPGSQGYYAGGSGTGVWQFVVGSQTNWPGTNGVGTGQPGTLLTNNTTSLSWTPAIADTYAFWVRRLGDDDYYESPVSAQYFLRKSEKIT